MAEGITMPVIPLATGNLLSLPPKVVTVQVSYPLARQARKYRWWEPLRDLLSDLAPVQDDIGGCNGAGARLR